MQRTLTIDLTSLEESYNVGRVKEHNATKIKVNVSSIGALGYIAVLRNELSELYCTEYMNPDGEGCISFDIPQSWAKTKKATLVIEAYNFDENDNPTMIEKTSEVTLLFEPSLSSDDAIVDEEVNGLMKWLGEIANRFELSAQQVEQIYDDLVEALRQADNISVTATQDATGATITVTDKEGHTVVTRIYNGTDGQDGADGFSPVATVVRGTNKATITITDKRGTTSADVYDGQGGTDLPLTPLSLSPITATALSSLDDGTYIVTNEGTVSTTAGGSISFVEGAIIAVQSDSGAKYASVINGLYAGYLSDQDDTEIELYAIPADLENFVTQSDMATALNLKANKATTYTKTEVDNLLDGKVASSSVATIWTGTQAEYDAITTKDSNTLYFIVEASS